MNIAQILREKGSDVVSVHSSNSVAEAVEMLNSANVGALLVIDGPDHLVGVLSERDIVRRIGADGVEVLQHPVAACMTPDPITCDIMMQVDEAMALMTQKRIRHLPVTRGTALVGVISIGDVVKRKIEQTEAEADAMKAYIAS